jgi:DNA-binding transcriptional regulator WhiA
MAQKDAIDEPIKNGKMEEMTPQMQELARLRAENCELSQKELGERMTPAISKSQVSKILSKIMKFYELYKDESSSTKETKEN